MQQVYTGIRVVEISGGMAGSLAAMVMADNGAEVIKIEPPAGDEVPDVEPGQEKRRLRPR